MAYTHAYTLTGRLLGVWAYRQQASTVSVHARGRIVGIRGTGLAFWKLNSVEVDLFFHAEPRRDAASWSGRRRYRVQVAALVAVSAVRLGRVSAMQARNPLSSNPQTFRLRCANAVAHYS